MSAQLPTSYHPIDWVKELGLESGIVIEFHNVPAPLVETIRRLDDRNQLETLFEKAVTTQSLEDLLTEVDALADGENHSEHSE